MVWTEHIPLDIQSLYEVYDYHHAAAIIATEFPVEFRELCDALREFRISESDITIKGGSESPIPKRLSSLLRPRGWTEIELVARIVIDEEGIEREISAHSHKVDYIKGRVAFDLEWNSKDQTFDRDLYAFRHFFDCDRISVGVLLTRSNDLDSLFKRLGEMSKYGASTTQMGKLLPRLYAGRNGGCPILVFGITSKLLRS